MGKKGSTQVTPVDPWEAGRADATFNRIDSYTPFGNLTYSGPNRNQANLQLNPYLAGNEERRMFSDRMLLDTALGRQMQMNQGGLPSLTSGINPGAMQEFFGLPSSLQSGFDQAPTPPAPPNTIPGSDTPSGAKGGGAKGGQQQLPGPPPGGPPQPGQKGGFTMPGGGPAPGSQQPYRPGADMSVKPQGQPTSAKGGFGDSFLSQGGIAGGQGQVGGKGGVGPQTNQVWGGGPAQGGGQMGGPPAGGGGQTGGQGFMAGGTQTHEEALASYNAEQQRRAEAGIPPLQYGPPTGPVTTPGEGELMNRGGQQQSQSNPLFGGTVGGLIDPDTFGQIGSLDQLEDFDLDRGRVEQATFDRTSSLLKPMYDQEYQSKVSDLRARGIPRDSEAFEREMSNFERNKGETFGRLADQSVLSGGQEQSRLFGLSSALGDRAMAGQQGLFNMADQLSQRDIQAQLQNANISSMNRATQFNELASLLGLQQVSSPGLNNFFQPGNVDMIGAYGLNQQGQMANAQNAASQKGGMMGGLGQLGGAAISAGGPAGPLASLLSDRRLKRDIKRIGTVNGHPWYSFEYIWGEKSEGVMSDEVPQEFVIKHPSGYDMVDYSRIL